MQGINNSKKVSGIITTYHREPSIVEKAINSMIKQTYPMYEIIVVDDNEDYSLFSVGIKKLCKELNVIYIKQNGNQGACCARNLGISNCDGDFIGFLDDDDEWLPNKIEKQLEIFETDDAIGLVFCQGVIKHIETGQIEDYYNTANFISKVTFNDLLCGDRIGSTSQSLIRKECFCKVGGFWEKQPARQDYEMWIRISQHFLVYGTPDKLFVHNMHDGEQISKNTKKSYWGYKNIYEMYKKYYKRNSIAKYHIITFLYVTRFNFSLFNVLVFLKKHWLELLIWLKILKLDSKGTYDN